MISRRSLIARVMAAVLLSSLAAAGAIAYQAVRVRSLIADLSLIHDDFVPVSRQLDELRRESRAVGRALALNDTEALRRTLRNSQELNPSMLRLEHALITLDRQIELLAREATGAEAASLISSLIAAAEELHVEQQRLKARISDLAAELEGNTSAVDAKQRDAERLATRFESRIDRLGTLVDGFADRAFELAREKEQQTVRYVVVAVALSLAVASIALLYVARALRAVDALRAAALRLRTGDYRAAELPESDDEIGDLAREFGHMSASISERDQRLRSQNQELEAANEALQREHDARLRAERLAAAGELASRITHEIRNPLSSKGLNAEMLAHSLTGAS
ncbi:MAG: HAMP domain-containing protein, partial [Deltaproteobacteria bacterium]|nr:HAMP domain-containing protein [Deltaproteobacteria bacterium]